MNIGILGAGQLGIALAYLLNQKKHKVFVWEHDLNVCNKIKSAREIPDKLPGFIIPQKIEITNNIFDVLQYDVIINAVPTQFIRSYFSLINNYNFSNKIVVNVSKGFEVKSGLDISTMFKQEFPTITDDNFVALAGPSFAKELAIKQSPTAIVSACKNIDTANLIRDLFSNNYLRIYSNNDVIGVEIGGSVKNIIAIAAGIIDGLNMGHNTKAALLTRGLAEMSRLGVKMGALKETFSGLSGIGDLFLTCNSSLSRNWTVGNRIGSGETLKEILDDMTMVAEGVQTTKSIYELSKKLNVEMPITEMVYKVLFEDYGPLEAIRELMGRARKIED